MDVKPQKHRSLSNASESYHVEFVDGFDGCVTDLNGDGSELELQFTSIQPPREGKSVVLHGEQGQVWLGKMVDDFGRANLCHYP